MKIAVLMSTGQDPKFPLEVQPFKGITRKGPPILNPLDAIALEFALKIKSENSATATSITVGDDSMVPSVRASIELGMDESVLLRVDDQTQLDPVSTSKALESVMSSCGFSLILCGASSLDMGGSIVPSMLAQMLSMPVVTRVRDIEIALDGKSCKVWRKVRGYTEVLEVSLPVVLAVEMGPEPRRASLKRMIRTRNAEIVTKQAPETLIPCVRIDKYTLPKPRKKKSFPMPASASGADRLDALMAGGPSKAKSSSIIDSEPEEAAKSLAGIIKKVISQK